HALVWPSLARRANGLLARRLPAQADYRDYQHLERYQRLSRAFPATSRGSEARCVAGRRLSARDAGDSARGSISETDHDALSKSIGVGDRRAASFLPGGWRSADGWLRYNHAGAVGGCDQHESANELH